MIASKDPLKAGIIRVLKPEMLDLGFTRLGTRAFGRVVSEILHVLVLDQYLHGSKRYSAHYNAMPLFVSHDHIVLTPPGDSLSDYSAANHDAAARGLAKLVERVKTVAVPWFSSTSTVRGYIGELDRCSFRPVGPVLWLKACGLARAGEYAVAADTLDTMERETTNPYLLGARFQALREAVRRQDVDALLAEWKETTVASLKLNGLIDEG